MLASFNHAEWLKGLTFDVVSRNSKLIVGKVKITGVKVAAVKAERPIKPAIEALAPSEMDGRSEIEHQNRIMMMRARYDKRCDPLTGKPMDAEQQKECKPNADYVDPAWPKNGRNAHANMDGIKLITDACLAIARSEEDDD